MYKASFTTAELKEHLEKSLGFAIVSLTRIAGGGAINFRAERACDGLRFLVKCFVPERKANYDRLISNLRMMEGVKAPTRLFEGTCPETFRAYHVVCLAWRDGETSDPSRMSDGVWVGFLKDYLVFAERMQHAVAAGSADIPLETWRREAFGLCRGVCGLFLRGVLASLEGADLAVRREDLRIVYGDFHTGNVLFRNGSVECFMDLENLTLRYGPSDILLYCLHAARRLGRAGRRRVLERFGEAVRLLPYSTYEWHMAINFAILASFRRRTKGFKRCGIFAAMANAAAIRLYEQFRRQVRDNARA